MNDISTSYDAYLSLPDDWERMPIGDSNKAVGDMTLEELDEYMSPIFEAFAPSPDTEVLETQQADQFREILDLFPDPPIHRQGEQLLQRQSDTWPEFHLSPVGANGAHRDMTQCRPLAPQGNCTPDMIEYPLSSPELDEEDMEGPPHSPSIELSQLGPDEHYVDLREIRPMHISFKTADPYEPERLYQRRLAKYKAAMKISDERKRERIAAGLDSNEVNNF